MNKSSCVESLVMKYKKDQRDEDLVTILDLFTPFIEKSLRKFNFHNDTEDVRQNLNITIWKAINGYDSSRNVKFSTYVISALKNTLFNARADYTKQHCNKSWGANEESQNYIVSLSTPCNTDETLTLLDILKDDTTEKKLCSNDFVEKVLDKSKDIDESLYCVLSTISLGGGYRDAASLLNISHQYAYDIVEKYRSKLKHFILSGTGEER